MPSSTRAVTARLRAGLACLSLVATTLVGVAVLGGTAQAAAIQPPANMLPLLTPQHPRLLATAATFATTKTRITSDSRLRAWYDKVKADADGILPTAPPTGLSTAGIDEAKRRVYSLALVYRVTGDTRYAERAKRELLAFAAVPAWNSGQFLDVGEISNSMAIGYDWLYDYLSTSDKATIRTAIIDKALRPALVSYALPNSFFTQTHNWNLVCNGVALGALAVGTDSQLTDEQRGVVNEVLRNSVISIQNGIGSYAPDGGGWESPQYWQYAGEYLFTYLAAMNTATNTDFGLSGLPGLANTGDYAIHVSGTTGMTFNYGDGGTDRLGQVTPGSQVPFMMWLAKRYGKPYYASWEADLADQSAAPMDILWYDPALVSGPAHPITTDGYFAGVEVATARSGWDDPYGVFVGTKGMRSAYDQSVAHANLDAGDFVLDAGGVRWFDDLGADGYSSPGFFDWQKDAGGRWDYYVTRPEGQNTMLLGTGPTASTALNAGARITSRASTPQKWYAITDLTNIYGGRVQRAQRGVQLFDDRRQVLVQDEVRAATPIDYQQFLHTHAQVVVAADGRSAMLYRGTQRLWVQLLTPGGQLLTGDATPLPGIAAPAAQGSQPAAYTLTVRLPAITDTTVALRMVPLATGQQPPSSTPAVQPLSSWSAAPASPAALTGIRAGDGQVTGFDPHTYRYDVALPANSVRPPSITPLAAGGTFATATQATSVPGTSRVTTWQLDEHGDKVYGPTYEVHFRQDGGTGRSLPVAAVSASADDGNKPGNVVDGNLGTRWSAGGDGQTLTLDLGRPRHVAAVGVAFFNGFLRTSTIDVQTSVTGHTWSAGVTRAASSGTSDEAERFAFASRMARYVRVVGHGNSQSNFNSITEVRIYATEADAQADERPRPVVLDTVTATPAAAPDLALGQHVRLSLAGTRTDGNDADLSAATVTWTTIQPEVATVDSDGVVTATGGGSTTIGALVTLGTVWKAVRVPVSVVDTGHIEPVADTYVWNGEDRTHGTSTALEVANNPDLGSGFERVSYLTFPLAKVRGTVASATLHIYGGIDRGSPSPSANAVRAVADPSWSEAAVTWNTRPQLGDSVGTFSIDTTMSWHTVDVTEYVRAQLAAGVDVSLGIASTANNFGPHSVFNSKEASVNHPYLEVTLA